jgi:hypothetical protein
MRSALKFAAVAVSTCGLLTGCSGELEPDDTAVSGEGPSEGPEEETPGAESSDEQPLAEADAGPEVVGDVELVTEACYLAADVWSGMTELEDAQTDLLRDLTATANRSGNPQVRDSAAQIRSSWALVHRAFGRPGSPTALEDFASAMERFVGGIKEMDEQCEPVGVQVRRPAVAGS